MRLRTCALCACLLTLAVSILGCNNTLNPLCSSARPAPLIESLSPSTLSLAQVQQGAVVTITGSNFVSASEVLINTTPLAATVVSDTELKIKLSTDVIPAAGTVKVMVDTPAGNSGNVGCTSGGTSSALVLTVN